MNARLEIITEEKTLTGTFCGITAYSNKILRSFNSLILFAIIINNLEMIFGINHVKIFLQFAI